MDYELIVIKILERISKNYYYIIRGINRIMVLYGVNQTTEKVSEFVGKLVWKYQLPSTCNEILLISHKGKEIILLNIDETTGDTVEDIIKRITTAMKAQREKLYLFVGEPFDNIECFVEAYNRVKTICYAPLIFENEYVFREKTFNLDSSSTRICTIDYPIEAERMIIEKNSDGLKTMVFSQLDMIIRQAGKNPVSIYYGIQELLAPFYSHSAPDKFIKELEKMESNLGRMKDFRGIRKAFDEIIKVLDEHQKQMENQIAVSAVEQVISYINSNYTSIISLTDVAEKVGLNANYLSKLFRQTEGITFKDYLTGVRLNAAKRYLKESNYKLQDIADRTGYADVKNFIKMFKKQVGISPNEYRKIMTRRGEI